MVIIGSRTEIQAFKEMVTNRDINKYLKPIIQYDPNDENDKHITLIEFLGDKINFIDEYDVVVKWV